MTSGEPNHKNKSDIGAIHLKDKLNSSDKKRLIQNNFKLMRALITKKNLRMKFDFLIFKNLRQLQSSTV